MDYPRSAAYCMSFDVSKQTQLSFYDLFCCSGSHNGNLKDHLLTEKRCGY